MTVDERIEKLLNQHGNTISDLQNPINRPIDMYKTLVEQAKKFAGVLGETTNRALCEYAFHLVDIIDRMEWALQNATKPSGKDIHIYVGDMSVSVSNASKQSIDSLLLFIKDAILKQE